MTNQIDDPNSSQDTTEILEVQITTPQEIADALSNHRIGKVLGKRILREIRECSDTQEAFGLAYAAIFDKGEDADSIMQELGLVEPEQAESTQPDLSIIEILEDTSSQTQLATDTEESDK